MKTSSFLRLFVMLSALVLAPLAGRAAEDLNAVKARMEQRVSIIDGLKDRQILGESNRGFLAVRGAASPTDEKVVADENTDRRTVYAALAAQTGTNADAVGRQRAQQIGIRSKRGVWVQDANGEWRQK